MTEPGFTGGGAELRTRMLHRAVHDVMPEVGLEFVEGSRRRLWSADRLNAVAHGVPPRLTQLSSRSSAKEVARVVTASRLTVACTTFTASLVEPRKLSGVVLDAHNLEWSVNEQLAAGSDGYVKRAGYRLTTDWVRGFEEKLAKSVAGVWAVSEDEAAWFESVGARVWIVPNGVEAPLVTRPPGDDKEILFVGSLNSMFNRQGLEWFLSEVWPLVRKETPKARLTVVGAGPSLRAPPGVEQIGFVEDLEPFYGRCAFCIAPLLSGAGTRLKILEAMAWERPVVATRTGASGLGLGTGDGVLQADDARGFADLAGQLLSDTKAAAENGERARKKAGEFSWDRVGTVAVRSLEELGL